MNIKLRNINDNKMSDGLQAAIDVINQINNSNDENLTIDFSNIGFVTPLY